MSVSKNTYGIVGYDLTQYRNKICTEENCESNWYEDLIDYQRIGNIQLFDAPTDGEHLYFGYIFFETDDNYENITYSHNLTEFNHIGNIVKEELFNKLGIELDYPKIIVFNEFT